VTTETFWCRPITALAHAWHVVLALAGSLVAVASPRTGAALLIAALVFVLTDALTGVSPGRRWTPERASQNVVAAQPEHAPPHEQTAPPERADSRFRVILTANYDAGRDGLVYRDWIRRPLARLRRLTGPVSPGWLGWLVIAIAWLVAAAILRVAGHHGVAVGIVQLPPTIGMVLTLALLLELSAADWSPAAGDNGTGVGVAIALARALDASPPHNVAIEIVLAGAGDLGGFGISRYLRTHQAHRAKSTTAVIGISACTAGNLCWWRSDGPLVALRFGAGLRQLAAEVAHHEAYLGATAYVGRGQTPALPARVAGVPAIAIGCIDGYGLTPRSHQMNDTADALEQSAADKAVQFGLMLVDAIDARLAAEQPHRTPSTV
jgi:hypothetical protein